MFVSVWGYFSALLVISGTSPICRNSKCSAVPDFRSKWELNSKIKTQRGAIIHTVFNFMRSHNYV